MKLQHGDDFQGDIRANFSSNIWHQMDVTALHHHLECSLAKIIRYPEMKATSLGQMIAAKCGVEESQVVVGNGSIELIYLLAEAFKGTKSTIVVPTFSEYESACRQHNHQVNCCKSDSIETVAKQFQPTLMWLCRPNNPDGSCLQLSRLKDMVANHKEILFVIDQAYCDFSFNEPIPNSWVDEYPNIVLLQSLTKRYAIPGLRLGFCIANHSIIEQLKSLQIPWSVNLLAIEAGKFLLNREDKIPLSEWLKEKIQFQNAIDAIEGFNTIASETPYFLVKLQLGKAAALKSFLIEKGILIRDATNFKGLEGEYFRLNTLTKEKNELLINALKEWKNIITQ